MTTTRPWDRTIAIIGGGISGLSAAEAVQRQSRAAGEPVKTILLEADAELGGKVRSSRDEGFVVEAGPHGFLGREPAVFRLIDRLGIGEGLLRADPNSRKRFLVRGGALCEVPMKPPKFLSSPILSVGGRLRVLLEPFIPAEPPEEESVSEFARRRIGKEAAEVLVDAMVTGIYGGDPSALSLRSAFPRMNELEVRYGSLIKAQLALARERKGESPEDKDQRENLHSFRRGLQSLIDGLADTPTEVRTGAAVDRIDRVQDRLRLVGSFGQLDADAVISTASADQLARMAGHAAPAAADHAASVPYAPVTVVVLAFGAQDVAHPLDGFGYLAPAREARSVMGVVWASSVFPEHAPAGYALFRCMIGGVRSAELADADDEALLEMCRAELVDSVGLRPGARLEFSRIIRWPRGIPQYNKGHASRVEAAEAVAEQLPGLVVGGNGYRGVAMIDCIQAADGLADAALSQIRAVRSGGLSGSRRR